VKVWGCNQGCYDTSLIEDGGADVEGTSVLTATLPFYTDYKANPMLKAVAKEFGGAEKMDGNAVNALVGALLFQEAVEKATAGGGTLTRKSVFDALAATHDFEAQGIIGPTDIGNRQPPSCVVISQVKDGKWKRVHPTKVGTFDCNPKNSQKIKLDLLN